MKNLLILVLIMVMTLTFCMGAQAKVYEFNDFAVNGFSIDVPAGWFVTEDNSNNKFDFNSPHGSVSVARMGGTELITFLYASSEGMYGPTFASAIAAQLEGSNLVDNGDGDFQFTYTKNGVEIIVRTRHIGHLGIVMETQNGFDDIQSILGTLY